MISSKNVWPVIVALLWGDIAIVEETLPKPLFSAMKAALPAAKALRLRDFPPFSKTLRAKDWETTVEHFAQAGRQLNKVVPIEGRSPFIKAALHYLSTDSTASWNALESNLHELAVHDKALALHMKGVKLTPQTAILPKMRALVKRITGKPTHALTLEERVKARLEKPELAVKYAKVEKEAKESYLGHLAHLILGKGEHHLPTHEIETELGKKGVTHMFYPKGFVGRVSHNNKLFTHAGKEIQGSPTYPVRMNPQYDPKADKGYVFTALPATGKGNRYYTKEHGEKATVKAHSKAASLKSATVDLPAILVRDMHSSSERTQAAATVVALILSTGIRAGTPGNATKGEATYGATTLLRKHVRFNKQGVLLRFAAGKSGVMVTHKVSRSTALGDALYHSIQRFAKAAPKPDSQIFMINGSQLWGKTVNSYLQHITGQDVTVHKFRHVLGTGTASALLSKNPFEGKSGYTQKEVERWYLHTMEKVGEKLNHIIRGASGTKITGRTAIKYYIDPGLQEAFFHKLGLEKPVFLH